MKKLKLGIVGKGFVGGSVSYGFDRNVKQIIVDPLHSKITLEQCVKKKPQIIFICVPTPSFINGEIDIHIARSILSELNDLKYEGIVVIKSTITPNYLTRFTQDFNLRIVYNPEFLTEANAHWDFCNPSMQILGGEWDDCEEVEKAYVQHSRVKVVPTFKTDIITASLLKYTINSFLATKVTFMNELHALHQSSGAESSWDQFTDMLKRDPRIGDTHLQVPGPDGNFGFGGHCFPKDTEAFVQYSSKQNTLLNLLQKAININGKIRGSDIEGI